MQEPAVLLQANAYNLLFRVSRYGFHDKNHAAHGVDHASIRGVHRFELVIVLLTV